MSNPSYLEDYLKILYDLLVDEFDEISKPNVSTNYLLRKESKYYKITYGLEIGTTFKNGRCLGFYIGNSFDRMEKQFIIQSEDYQVKKFLDFLNNKWIEHNNDINKRKSILKSKIESIEDLWIIKSIERLLLISPSDVNN